MNIISCLKKGIAAVSVFALALVASPMVNAGVEDFTDYSAIPSWAYDALDELVAQGVINGHSDGSFGPAGELQRDQVTKIMVLATGVEIDTDGGPSFSDLNTGDWSYDYAETMHNYGWIDGYPNGEFQPANIINMAEFLKMVVNAFEMDFDTTGAPHFDDVPANAWFYNYVETAYNNGLVAGFADGSFDPSRPVNRAEAVKIVYDAQLVVAGPTGAAEGTLSVELSTETPNGTNIPYNATSVPFQTIELTASDDADVEVSSLTFTRLGLGDNDDFDNVWLEIDGFKVGNDKSVNNDDVVELRFNPPIVVPAGQTLVADLVASLEESTNALQNVGSHNRFAIVSADDIASTAANVSGDFPIEGEEMEIASYEVSQVSFSTLGSDTTVDVGANFVEIGKFRLQNEGSTNKDIELRAMTFKNDGIAQLDETLENVALYVSGEQVSAETIIDGDYITFRLDNGVTGGYVIEDGDSRIFSIRADIVSAEDGDNINFKVDNYEDIVAIEIGTSFGVKAVSDDPNGTTFANGETTDSNSISCANEDAEDNCARVRAYKLDSGDLNVSRDPASLGNQQYAPGSNDVVLLTARIIVDQPLIVDGVTLRVGSGTTIIDGASSALPAGNNTIEELNAQFDNFRLFLNDSLIDSENDFTGTFATANIDFNTTFEIAGTSILKLVVNIENDAQTGSQLKVSLDADDFDSPEYISTGDQVTADELLGDAEGSFVEVTESTIDITRTDGLSNGETIVAGVNDVTFMKFVLDNNDSGDVNVTSITVNAVATGNAREYQNFTTAIFSDGVQQGSSKNLSSVGGATFNDLSVIVPSAGQKEFTVVVNTIESSASIVQFVDAVANPTIDTTADFAVGDIITDGTTEYTMLAADIQAAFDPAVTALLSWTLATDAIYQKHTIQFDVVAADVDNVENGQTVEILEGGLPLCVAVNNCSGPTGTVGALNVLDGTDFEMVQSGRLIVENPSFTVGDRLLVAGQTSVEVARFQFTAVDDIVEVKDFYLENLGALGAAAEDRMDFMLYNEAGQLVQVKQMTGNVLHFELANNDRISVPKGNSTFVTVRADIRDINRADQTGSELELSILTGNALFGDSTGIEAVTAATGSDLDAAVIASTGLATYPRFGVYRTKLAFAHAATQPTLSAQSAIAVLPGVIGDTPTAGEEIYQFTVTADNAYRATFNTVTFNVSGDALDAPAGTDDYQLVRCGDASCTEGSSNIIALVADVNVSTPSPVKFVLTNDEQIQAGSTLNYQIRTGSSLSLGTSTEQTSVDVNWVTDAAYVAPAATAAAASLAAENIIWSDRANDGLNGPFSNGFYLIVPSGNDGAEE